jgi:hypothetical protein
VDKRCGFVKKLLKFMDWKVEPGTECTLMLPLGFVFFWFFLMRLGMPQAILLIMAMWILRYPAHRYHAVPSPGFELTTLWLRVRRPNHSATTLLPLGLQQVHGDPSDTGIPSMMCVNHQHQLGIYQAKEDGKHRSLRG